MWNEDWYSQAAAGWKRSRWTEGIKSVQHVRAVYPLTEAHVLSTCAATGLIGGWVSVFTGVEKQLYPPTVRAAPILRLKSEDRAVESARQPACSAFSSSHKLFLVVRVLMFISPGVSSPALSHRFHTFLLANLTVLLPAAESEPGVGESERQSYCRCKCCCSQTKRCLWGNEWREPLTSLITSSLPC